MHDWRRAPDDQRVRDRIVSDFDRNVLVEAGAGSGKTYSLAMRMAAGIERGAFGVDGMAAVTFTRKAAAELRGRFQEALEERLRGAKGDAERQRLGGALAGIEQLFAGTIHAFCAHLLRERPVDAHVAPGFEELGDVDDLRLRRQAWRDYIVEARAAGSGPMLDLLEAGVRPKELDDAFAAVCEHEDVEFDMGEGDAPNPAAAWKAVERYWKKLSALRSGEFDEDTNCVLQQRYEELEGRKHLARRHRPAALAAYLHRWPRKAVQWRWGGNGKAVQLLLDAFSSEVIDPFLEAWHAYVHRLAMAVLVDARTHYFLARRRQNAVNYVDLLQITSRMLRGCAHVRQALQAKYRWLFVDEFQDTDPIQAEIFLMLAGRETADTSRSGTILDPFSLPLRPGALFVVGDPKQSIFRFRRADIDTYNRVAARILDTGGERLSLTANFRSLPGVCALANTVFPPLFGALSSPWSPPFEKLAPVREEAEGGEGPRIARLTIPAVPKGIDPSTEEARAIASYIRSEVTGGRRKYGDFLVLTRLRRRLSTFSSAFDALEIPVEVSGAGFFCRSPEVKALAMLLAALADPLDSVSLVGVLRGPLFGISDPELFRFREAGGRFELSAPPPDISEAPAVSRPEGEVRRVPEPVLSAMHRLQQMLRLTRTLPLGAALDRILEDTGWLAFASTQPAGAAAGRLLQAVDRAREVVEEGGGLAEAADALEEEESSNEAEALPLEPGRRDVVRLMNLHKAKGLEAPVVFLADAAHDYEFPVTVRVIREGGGAKGFLRVVTRRENATHTSTVVVGQPRDWATHEAVERQYLDAERLRLLYVAATRAEDLLVVCRAPNAKGRKAWLEFEQFLAGVPDLPVPQRDNPDRCPGRSVSSGDLSAASREAADAARQAAHARVREASWAVARVTGDGTAEIGTAQRANADLLKADGEDADGVKATSQMADDLPGGHLWGSLVHGLLEHAARHPAATRPDLERLARWLTVETPDLRRFVPGALELVDSLRRAPFWSELRDAKEVHVEVPFALRLDVGERLGPRPAAVTPTVVRGVIDLAYLTASGAWRILDYKTDRADDDKAILARHAPQLVQYGLAWTRVTAAPVDREGIVLVRAQRVAWA